MDDIDEIYAACIVEYARRFDDGVLTGPFYVIGKEARDSFRLPYDENIFRSALDILENIKVLTVYRRSGMQTYYRVEAKKFESAMANVSLGVRGYKLGRNTIEGRDYTFLESFNDVGPQYLQDALESYEDELEKIVARDDVDIEDEADQVIRVDSGSWTGLPCEFELSEAKREQLIVLLKDVEDRLSTLEVSNSEKSQIRSLVLASQMLAEAPDPPADLIWELINRANHIAGITALFVSILGLFN